MRGSGPARRAARRLAGAVLVLGLGVAPGGSPARSGLDDRVPLEDLLEIVALERQLLAVDARDGGQVAVELEIGERVRWSESRGQVGVVLTDRRILAVSTRSGAWQESRYRRTESPPAAALLGDRVALVETSERLLGFTGEGANLVEYRLGPRELVLASRTGANTGVFLTNRRALGLSARRGGFFSTDLQLREQLVEVTPRANLATVRTNRRLLIFRAPTGSWEVRRLDLR